MPQAYDTVLFGLAMVNRLPDVPHLAIDIEV